MPTHTVAQNVKAGGATVSSSTIYEASGEVIVTEAIAHPASDVVVSVAIDLDKLVSFYMVSSEDMAVVFFKAAAQDVTINLVAGVPYVWTEDSYFVQLLQDDVTEVQVTQTSGSTANFEIRVLQDATPA